MCEHRDAPYDHDCWTTTTTPEQVARMAAAMYFEPSGPDVDVTAGDMAGLPSVSKGQTMHDDFTTRHCTDWCSSSGVDPLWVPLLVQECEARESEGWQSSWPEIARSIGATYTDGTEYR